MPNWVITKIYITGPEDKIKEFEGKCLRPNEDEDGEFQRTFSFNRIKERPEELTNTISPSPKPEVRKVKDMQGNEIVVEVYRDIINEWDIQSAIKRGETPPEPIHVIIQPLPSKRNSVESMEVPTGTDGISTTGELNGTVRILTIPRRIKFSSSKPHGLVQRRLLWR
jgi:hypothetical protein